MFLELMKAKLANMKKIASNKARAEKQETERNAEQRSPA